MLLPPSRTTSLLSDTPLFTSTENFDLMARSEKVGSPLSTITRSLSGLSAYRPVPFNRRLLRCSWCISHLRTHAVVLANIYRPPRCPVPEFLEELAVIVTSIYTASNDRLVLCGGCCSTVRVLSGCPGAQLSGCWWNMSGIVAWLTRTRPVRHFTNSWRQSSDILATDTAESLSDVEIDDAGCI